MEKGEWKTEKKKKVVDTVDSKKRRRSGIWRWRRKRMERKKRGEGRKREVGRRENRKLEQKEEEMENDKKRGKSPK